MKVLSVNVGARGTIALKGREVETGIHKRPVEGRVRVGELGLEGDFISDPRYHGGPERAVYAYPFEHYAAWQPEVPVKLELGGFGENLTLLGLTEEAIGLGDVLAVGTCRLQVTAPRAPCGKLGAKVGGGAAFIRAFERSRRYGFYLRVDAPGDVGAGDAITVASQDPAGVSIAELVGLLRADAPARDRVERALSARAVMKGLRRELEKRLS